MAASQTYSPKYFEKIGALSRSSAAVVAPLAMELIHPRSVVDIGCGTGAWAAAFKALGTEVIGVDGEYCDPRTMEIGLDEFVAADLTRPLPLDTSFDLAVCLEVAEHLEPDIADHFISTLTQLAPVVLFSAAIPYQGGLHHVNEQWPPYWIKRFAAHDFTAFDPFRRLIWQNKKVAWWYAQNLLLFVRRDALTRFPAIHLDASSLDRCASLVHPECLLKLVWQQEVAQSSAELKSATHDGAMILVVDDAQFGDLQAYGRTIRPFPEIDGYFAGPPADSRAAIAALHAQRRGGASYLAFAWPSFWWLEYYAEFASHLRTRYAETHRSARWVIFGLKGSA